MQNENRSFWKDFESFAEAEKSVYHTFPYVCESCLHERTLAHKKQDGISFDTPSCFFQYYEGDFLFTKHDLNIICQKVCITIGNKSLCKITLRVQPNGKYVRITLTDHALRDCILMTSFIRSHAYSTSAVCIDCLFNSCNICSLQLHTPLP
jgi:hypothetical protein